MGKVGANSSNSWCYCMEGSAPEALPSDKGSGLHVFVLLELLELISLIGLRLLHRGASGYSDALCCSMQLRERHTLLEHLTGARASTGPRRGRRVGSYMFTLCRASSSAGQCADAC